MSSGTAEVDGRLATRAWLHIAALCAVAIAQPLLDLLGSNPEFFVAHHAGRLDILLLIGGLILVTPAVLTAPVWLAGLLGERPRSALLGVVVAGLVFVLVMPLAKRAGITTWPPAAAVSAAVGIAAAIAHARLAAVRAFLTVLAIAIVIVPGVFLAQPEIRNLIRLPAFQTAGNLASPAEGTAPPSRTPVVMIILDELPLVSLLDADHQIDPVLYPRFAALARDGVWFRNATTVSDFTRYAVPSIVSGKYPERRALPNAADHPDTVFTLLGRTHRLEVTEPVTRLCPEALCTNSDAAPAGERLAAMARDLRVVFLLNLVTDDLAAGLPDVTATWAGFHESSDQDALDSASIGSGGDDEDRAEIEADVRRRWRSGMGASRVDPLVRFIDEIQAEDPQPTLYFLHSLISHLPHHMLPGDRENTTRASIPGKAGGHWAKDQPWAVRQQQQRQLMQVGYIDGVVGRVVQRLKDAGLYDRALIVITADHGIAFLPGATQRIFTNEIAAEIMRVPLIFKFPEGTTTAGRISDANVETIDILPTIADVLDVQMAWEPDGTSLLDPSRPERRRKTMLPAIAGGRRELRPNESAIEGALARKLAWFGDGTENPHRAPRLEPYDDLIGQPVTALRVVDGGGAVEVLHSSAYDNVDTAAPEMPFDIAGRFGSPRPDTALAVAINGVVEAVTRTWESNARGWLATPRLDVWRPGQNELQVFVLENDSSGVLLRRAAVGQQRPYDLNLISESANRDWGVQRGGFYPLETVPGGPEFRWTRGVAQIANSFTHRRPVAVQVEVLAVPGGVPKNLKVEADDCTLFDGEVRHGWAATLSLAHCDLPAHDFMLRFTTAASRVATDTRSLGVALSRVVIQ